MSIVGIDFGSSLNKIGCINQNVFKIITNNLKNPSTPSVAFLNHKDKWLFGERAAKLGLNKPLQFIYETKLMLGNENDSIIEKSQQYWTFQNGKDENNNIILTINVDKEELKYSPIEVTSLIFKNLIDISKKNLPKEVNKTVISIPCHFNKTQINDLFEATKKAELKQVHFVVDPILASVAYLFNMKADISKERKIFVYNLGSSFLEVSILQIKENETNQIKTEFNEDINVHQIDKNMFDCVKEKMKTNYPAKEDFLNNPKTQRKLYNACIEAKSFLSDKESTEITIEDEDDEEGTGNLTITITEKEFNEINEDIFNKSKETIEKIINESKIEANSIDYVFLIGGSTYLNQIRQQIKEKTLKEPCSYADPRETVALGACIIGLYHSIRESTEEEKINIENCIIYQSNKNFISKLEEFLKFDEQIEFPIDTNNNTIIFQDNFQNPKSDESYFSLGYFSSCYSTNFSSYAEGYSISSGNPEEKINIKQSERKQTEQKPTRISESINGKLICANNLSENNSYAIASIIRVNGCIKETRNQKKSNVINDSNNPNYNLEFNFQNLKKGHSLLISIYNNNNECLLGNKIPLTDIEQNQNHDYEFPLKKFLKTYNPSWKDFGEITDATIKLNLNHEVVYSV